MTKPKTKRSVDWSVVEDAMRRSKRGIARPGDAELCQSAFDADRAEYGKRHQAVVEAVTLEERTRWGS